MKPRITWNVGLIGVTGLLLLFIGVNNQSWATATPGLLLMIASAGLAFRQRWASWLAIAALSAVLFIWGYATVTNFTWRSALGLAGVAFLLWEVIREMRRQRKEENRPLIALVQIRRQPNNFLTDRKIAAAAERVWGVRFFTSEDSSENKESPHFVVGRSPAFFVSAPGYAFLVNNFPTPYFEDAEKAALEMPEMRLQHIIREHRGWLSVDLLEMKDESQPRNSAYPAIAKLFVELLDDDCLALYTPETGRVVAFEPAMIEKLRGDHPLEVFGEMPFVPVVPVSGDDPRMKAAVEEARRRWPEFVAAFEKRDGEHFGVKAPITVDDNTEFIWVELDRIEGETLHGKLANDPVALGNLKCGDAVSVALSDLNDWNYLRNDEMVGGFTVKAIQAIQAEATAR